MLLLLSLLGLSVAVYLLSVLLALLAVLLGLLVSLSLVRGVPAAVYIGSTFILLNINTNPYKRTHVKINRVCLLSSSLGVLLKYNRIIQNENRKRNITKILINTARSKGLENFRLREKKGVGGLQQGPP